MVPSGQRTNRGKGVAAGADWILDALSEAVVVHDAEGVVRRGNLSAARLLGLSPDELNGRSLRDCLVLALDFLAAMQEVSSSGSARFRAAVRRSGDTLPVEVESRSAGPAATDRIVSVIREVAPAPGDAFRQIVESLPQLVWTCSPDGACDYLGPQWVAYTGKPADSHLGYGWLDQLHTGDRGRVAAEWESAAVSGLPFDTEFRILRHDQAYRWFRTRALPLRDAEGRIVKWVGTNTDIHDLNKAEHRLRRYELLSSHTRDILLLVSPGDGRIVEANDAAVRTYGYTRDELLGLTVADLRAVEELATLRSQLAQANDSNILFETRHRRKDGSYFPVEVSARGADIDGVRYVISVVRNITRRTEAEEALRRSEERFRSALENIPDLVVIYDRDMRMQYVNAAACELTGRSAEDLRGKCEDELWFREIHDAYLPLLDAALASRSTRSGEIEIDVPGAGKRSLRISFVPLLDADGEVREVLGIAHDFTDRHRAEEAVRNVALFPAQNPFPVLRIGRGGEVVYANPAAEGMVSLWKREGGSGPDCVTSAVHTALASGQIGELEIEHDDRLFSFIVTPVLDRGYANLYGREITESRRAELELAAAIERQELLTRVVGRLLAAEEPQKLVNSLASEVMTRLGCDMFVNYLVDPERGKLHLNASGGMDEEVVRSLEWLDFGAAVCGCVALEGQRTVAEDVASGNDPRTALVRSLGMQAYACFPLTGEGRTIGTLSFGSRNKLRFSPGELATIEAVAQHISIAMERLHSREALRGSQELYRAIARNIPEGGVWVVDRNLRYVQAEGPLVVQYGFDNARVEGKLLSEALPPVIGEQAAVRFGKALAGESAGYEDTYENRVMWTQYVPLTDEHGNVTLAMALALDITERKRLEEQIRQAQKLESIGLLAGGVAHDFNNLLVGILGNASLAQDVLPVTHDVRPLLDAVVHAGEQAANLTRQMLAYSGKGRFVVEPLDLSEVVCDILPLARTSLSRKIEVHLAAPPGLPPIEADRTQVQQVVTNLVINAGEAIGNAHGTIWIGTGLRHGPNGAPQVFFEVRDTGCGMPEEVRNRVFDPFFSTKFTGRGLGLAAVHGIMRGHGGTIEVESEPDRGSTFTAGFPVSEKAIARRRTAAVPAGAEGRGTVLVIDDERVVRDMAAAALRRYGYDVLVAEDGWRGLDLLRQFPGLISLVLLDLSMPGLDGEQTLPVLRQIRPDLPVLVSSGFSETEAMRVFAGQNVSGFVQKPYTVRQLLAQVAAVNGNG